jgi:hypothetical protein
MNDETSQTIVSTPEELISILDEANAAQLLSVQPLWLVEGVFKWAGEGVEPIDTPVERPAVGLPLVVPGTRYAITLTDTRWGLAKAATALVANLVLANPFNWALGSALATSQTVITLLENVQKLNDEERNTLLAISRAKRALHTGTRRDPTRQEISGAMAIEMDELDKALESLEDKGLIRVDSTRVRIVL